MSTSRRIQFGVFATVLVVIAASGFAVLATMRSALIGQIDDQLSAAADAFALIDDEAADRQLNQLAALASPNEQLSALVAFDENDKLLISVPSRRAGEALPAPDVGGVGVQTIRDREGSPFSIDAVAGSIQYRAVSVDVGSNVLLIATPLEDVRQTLRELLVTLVASAAVAIGAIGWISRLIVRAAFRPVDEIIVTAEAIGDGDLSRRIDMSTSVTDCRRLSGALNLMVGRLETSFAESETANERLRELVANASHELRTPLSSIRGYSELYLSGAAVGPDETRASMERINSEAIRTSEIVEALLALARIGEVTAGGFSKFDLVPVLVDAVAADHECGDDRDIALATPNTPVTVRGDAALVRRALDTILSNTRQHASGTPVAIDLALDHGHPVISIADAGPGLTAEQIERATDRFWQADTVRNRTTGGSGLGLSLVAAIVEVHCGTLEIKSNDGHGLTVRMNLPA